MIHKHKHRFVCNFEYPQIPVLMHTQIQSNLNAQNYCTNACIKPWINSDHLCTHFQVPLIKTDCFCLLKIFAMFISFGYRSLNTRARNTWCVQVTLHVHVEFWDTFHTASLHVQKLDSSAIGKLGHLGFQRIPVFSNKTHIYF